MSRRPGRRGQPSDPRVPTSPPPPPPAPPPGWGPPPSPGWAPVAGEPVPAPPGAPSGWMGAFVTCPICSTAIPPGYLRCPRCNCAAAPPPRPSRATLLRLVAYVVGVYLAALLLVVAFR